MIYMHLHNEIILFLQMLSLVHCLEVIWNERQLDNYPDSTVDTELCHASFSTTNNKLSLILLRPALTKLDFNV